MANDPTITATKAPSISDMLLEAGYRHEAVDRPYGKRKVINIKTGEVAGLMDAHEAAVFAQDILNKTQH